MKKRRIQIHTVGSQKKKKIKVEIHVYISQKHHPECNSASVLNFVKRLFYFEKMLCSVCSNGIELLLSILGYWVVKREMIRLMKDVALQCRS